MKLERMRIEELNAACGADCPARVAGQFGCWSRSRRGSMSPAKRETLKVIADELGTLPGRRDSDARRLEIGGRLVIEAMEAGAFAEPRYASFRVLVHQCHEQPKVNGFISAWREAVWCLRGRPEEALDPVRDLAGDVELVIAAILAEPKSKKRAGRPPDTNPKEDQQISEAWKAGKYRSFDEFAGTDAGRRFNLPARKLELAHNRHRKRQSRGAVK